jgi:hypothetical protein
LIDVRKGFGSARALNGFHGDVLDLLLGVGELFFEGCDLRLLSSRQFLERLDAKFAEAFLGFGILLRSRSTRSDSCSHRARWAAISVSSRCFSRA